MLKTTKCSRRLDIPGNSNSLDCKKKLTLNLKLGDAETCSTF